MSEQYTINNSSVINNYLYPFAFWLETCLSIFLRNLHLKGKHDNTVINIVSTLKKRKNAVTSIPRCYSNILVWIDPRAVSILHSSGDLLIQLRTHLLKILFSSHSMPGIWSHVSYLLFLVLVECFWMEEQSICFVVARR